MHEFFLYFKEYSMDDSVPPPTTAVDYWGHWETWRAYGDALNRPLCQPHATIEHQRAHIAKHHSEEQYRQVERFVGSVLFFRDALLPDDTLFTGYLQITEVHMVHPDEIHGRRRLVTLQGYVVNHESFDITDYELLSVALAPSTHVACCTP